MRVRATRQEALQRTLQVRELWVKGFTTSEIAKQLNITEDYVVSLKGKFLIIKDENIKKWGKEIVGTMKHNHEIIEAQLLKTLADTETQKTKMLETAKTEKKKMQIIRACNYEKLSVLRVVMAFEQNQVKILQSLGVFTPEINISQQVNIDKKILVVWGNQNGNTNNNDTVSTTQIPITVSQQQCEISDTNMRKKIREDDSSL